MRRGNTAPALVLAASLALALAACSGGATSTATAAPTATATPAATATPVYRFGVVGNQGSSSKPVPVTGLPPAARVIALTSSWEGSGVLLSNGASPPPRAT